MKKTLQGRAYFTTPQVTLGNGKPTMPVATRQPIVMDRRHPDPSSVTRSDRYPIPSFEYRMRPE